MAKSLIKLNSFGKLMWHKKYTFFVGWKLGMGFCCRVCSRRCILVRVQEHLKWYLELVCTSLLKVIFEWSVASYLCIFEVSSYIFFLPSANEGLSVMLDGPFSLDVFLFFL